MSKSPIDVTPLHGLTSGLNLYECVVASLPPASGTISKVHWWPFGTHEGILHRKRCELNRRNARTLEPSKSSIWMATKNFLRWWGVWKMTGYCYTTSMPTYRSCCWEDSPVAGVKNQPLGLVEDYLNWISTAQILSLPFTAITRVSMRWLDQLVAEKHSLVDVVNLCDLTWMRDETHNEDSWKH